MCVSNNLCLFKVEMISFIISYYFFNSGQLLVETDSSVNLRNDIFYILTVFQNSSFWFWLKLSAALNITQSQKTIL